MEMVQVAWAAIGLLAAAVFGMFGAFFYLGTKIDSVNGRVDSLTARVDSLGARIDALGERLDARIDSLTALLQAHIERHAG
jgi:hypothetical protein